MNTKEGGKKHKATMLKKLGSKEAVAEYYRNIGRKGGSTVGVAKGFASLNVGDDGLTGYQRASIAGRKGGLISRRTGVKNGEGTKTDKDILEAERILEEESGRN